MSFLIIPCFIGQINVKWKEDALFSERYGKVPTIGVGPLLIVWRRWRKF